MVFTEVNFLKRYFWPMIVGLGIYFSIYIIWTIRFKEGRDRLHNILPIKLHYIALIRFVFGILPVIIVFVYLELSRLFIPEEWHIFIERINGQLGLFFIFLCVLSIFIDIRFLLVRKKELFKSIAIILTGLAVVLSTGGLVHLLAINVLRPLPVGAEESYFYLWGLILSVIAAIVFYKRKSFTG
ncbi:hypothetical protein ACFLS9_05635 [Bacteroidota bacterium]